MTASRTLAEYYQWEETDRGIRIFMHSGMADRLQAEILRAADGGTEVGGILLGCIEEDRGKAITCIDDFAAVPCSYLGGPARIPSIWRPCCYGPRWRDANRPMRHPSSGIIAATCAMAYGYRPPTCR